MQHVAIDLGGRESQFCVRAATGEILDEGKISTHQLTKFFRKQPPSVVILETCAEANKIAEQTRPFGHDVRIVAATLAPSLGVGARRTKTDRRDAQALSLASCRLELPSVHIRSQRSRNDTSTYRAREALVEARTKLINSVRGWMRTELLRLPGGSTGTFPKRVRAKFDAPDHIEWLLCACDSLTEQIKLADHELASRAKEDEVCRRLMTVPGVGAVTAVRFRAAVDDVSRFKSAHALQAFLGLTPGERSSSMSKRRTGITKAGPSDVRKLLSQCAWSHWRTQKGEPMTEWVERVAERRGRAIASVALARKLAGILYALWRDESSYDSRLAAAPRDSFPASSRPLPASIVRNLLNRRVA